MFNIMFSNVTSFYGNSGNNHKKKSKISKNSVEILKYIVYRVYVIYSNIILIEFSRVYIHMLSEHEKFM